MYIEEGEGNGVIDWNTLGVVRKDTREERRHFLLNAILAVVLLLLGGLVIFV